MLGIKARAEYILGKHSTNKANTRLALRFALCLWPLPAKPSGTIGIVLIIGLYGLDGLSGTSTITKDINASMPPLKIF